MAEFYQWCAHNHRKADIDSLNEYAEVSGMDIEDYEDVLSFLDGQQEDSEELRLGRKRTASMTLHRGIGLRRDDLHPELAERIDHVLGGGSDPHLSGDLLNHIHRDGEGMGSCWSPRDWMADWHNKQVSIDPPGTMFPRMEPADYSVTVSGDWDGSRGQQGYDEDIYNLEPGAEVKVHGLKIKSRGKDGKDWVDLGGDNTVVRHATAPVLDKPADFPDDWFEQHWGDDDDAPLPVPEQTGPPPRPADKILNEWVNARDSVTPGNLRDWHAAPWTNPLEQTLYKEFQHDWWPNSEASKVRSPDKVNTGWYHHPDEPITHWLNVEDFLNERYPEAATGGKYGLERVTPILQRQVDDRMLSPEKMEEYGYIGHGNAITQAMLNLHNKLQGRKWDSPKDRMRYYELMLRHIGPNGKKVSRLAKLIVAMAWQEWAPKIKNTGVGTWACPEGGGCAHKDGSRSSYKVYHEGSNDPYPSYLNYSHYHTWIDDIDMNVKEPVLGINMLYVNANHRKDGVAEAMMRRLVEDHPGARIVPGDMSEQGQAFHDRMLEKEPKLGEVVTDDVAVHLSRNIVAQANRLLLAMAWDEWAPKIQGGCRDNGFRGCTYDRVGTEGRYIIPQAGAFLDYYHYNHRGQDQVAVSGIYTHPSNRGDGVAEAMMRRLSEDHPGVPIDPGVMTRDGQGFHDRMLDKDPQAKDLLLQANRVLLAMAWQDWAPKIRHYPNSYGGLAPDYHLYQIDHGPEEDEDSEMLGLDRNSSLSFQVIPNDKEVQIESIDTHPSFRNQGIAEAMMRKLHQEHPGHTIHPGPMSQAGRAFYHRMLEKEPEARSIVAHANQVLRHANYLESPEGRAHFEQLMQMQQQTENFRNGPHDNWYHVSPHDLPEGTKLVPGGVGNSATSQDFYDMGFGDDAGNLKDMGSGRPQHVWLTPDLDDAHFWSAALNAPHIYQVDPHETPSPWNGTGTDGFVSPGATIRKKVSGGQ
jgi:GNAT superfamily N-acetyltransferase